MIPSGRGWAHHSLIFGNGVDINSTLSGSRWAPTSASDASAQVGTDLVAPAPAIVADLITATVNALRIGPADSLTVAGNTEDAYWLKYSFQHTQMAADAQINERPTGEFWMQVAVRFDWNPTGGGGSHTMAYLRLICQTESGETALGGFEFRNIGTQSATQFDRSGVTNALTPITGESLSNPSGGQTPTGAGQARDFNQAAIGGLKNDRWYTLRFHYVPDPTPVGSSADQGALGGYIEVSGCEGDLDRGDSPVKPFSGGAGFEMLFQGAGHGDASYNHRYIHGGGKLAAVHFGIQHQNSDNLLAANHYFRNWCWGTTDPSLGDGINTPSAGMLGTTSWFRQSGGLCAPHLGNQTADGTTVKCKVGGRYEGGLFKTGGTSIEAVVQWSTDPTFASIDETNSATTTVTERWCWSKTVAGLPQNSTVYFRIKYIVDGVDEFLSSISTLKTVSATTPGTIVINWGSCNRSHGASGAQGPASAYDVMAQPNFHVDCGDRFYADSTATGDGVYGGALAPADYIASNGGTRSGRQTAIENISVRQTYGHSQVEKMYCRAATINIRSDHDAGRDGFDGAGTTYGGAAANADGQLLANEFAEVARNMYLSHNQFLWDKNIRLTFTGGTYSHANKRITKAAGTFDNVVVGDRFECTAGTNATPGYYTISAKTTSTIDLTVSLGAGADTQVDIAGTIYPTVFYGQSDTAKCSFFFLDTRTHFNKASGTVLGITQNTALLNAIAATTKPNVFLFADGPWHTTNAEATDNFGGYTGQRNPLFDEIQNNANITAAYLMCADRHYCIINRANFTAWPKIKGCFMSSPLNNTTLDPTTDSTGVDVFQHRGGKSGSQVARLYMQATIQEGAGQVSVSVINGETGLSVFALSFGGGAGAMRLISGPLADDDEER